MDINLTLVLFVIQIGILAVSGVFLLISLSNLWGLEKLGKFPAPKRTPFVSILVPARNEEKNIKSCVESLLAQDYARFEVLVLDDHSEDETGKILKSIKDKKLKFWKGKPLPEDWIGKPWACHQLSEKATGELLLFTDADTVHEPGALKAAVAAMEAEKADFVTALPREAAYSWSEALVIPIIPWSLHTFMPLILAKRTKWASLSATIGQFMLFRRAAYRKIGGYEAIRDKVLDDVTFGRKIRAFGLKWRMYDGSKQIQCRMYTNISQVLEGFGKFCFSALKNNIFYFGAVLVILLGVFYLPWLILFLGVAGFSIGSFGLALASILLIFLTWVITNRRFGFPFALTLLYPLIIGMVTFAAVYSMVLTYTGRVTWKGRKIKVF